MALSVIRVFSRHGANVLRMKNLYQNMCKKNFSSFGGHKNGLIVFTTGICVAVATATLSANRLRASPPSHTRKSIMEDKNDKEDDIALGVQETPKKKLVVHRGELERYLFEGLEELKFFEKDDLSVRTYYLSINKKDDKESDLCKQFAIQYSSIKDESSNDISIQRLENQEYVKLMEEHLFIDKKEWKKPVPIALVKLMENAEHKKTNNYNKITKQYTKQGTMQTAVQNFKEISTEEEVRSLEDTSKKIIIGKIGEKINTNVRDYSTYGKNEKRRKKEEKGVTTLEILNKDTNELLKFRYLEDKDETNENKELNANDEYDESEDIGVSKLK